VSKLDVCVGYMREYMTLRLGRYILINLPGMRVDGLDPTR
jgi:hypothetical protein